MGQGFAELQFRQSEYPSAGKCVAWPGGRAPHVLTVRAAPSTEKTCGLDGFQCPRAYSEQSRSTHCVARRVGRLVPLLAARLRRSWSRQGRAVQALARIKDAASGERQ